jgi:hypothetical protein
LDLAGLQTGLETAKATGALSATEQMANLERLKAQAASCGSSSSRTRTKELAISSIYGRTRLSKKSS